LPLSFRNSLVLGLQALETLTPETVEVLIARRFGQSHGWQYRFSGWMYNLRSSWFQYRDAFSQSLLSPSQLVMRLFFSWYAPLFGKLALYAARCDELVADHQALRAVHVDDVAESLVAYHVGRRFLDTKFWPTIYKQSDKYEIPPYLPFTSLSQLREKGLTTGRVRRLLQHELSQRTNDISPLPVLAKRLEALGNDQTIVPDCQAKVAAEVFFPDQIQGIRRQFDKVWLESVLTSWRKRYNKSRVERQRLQLLLHRANREMLPEDEIWECTQLIEQCVDKRDEAARIFKQLLKTHPRDVRTNFHIGRFLLSLNDPAGVSALEHAMEVDKAQTVEACTLISRFMREKGQAERADFYQRRAKNFQRSNAKHDLVV
jgi:hypothetical protein